MARNELLVCVDLSPRTARVLEAAVVLAADLGAHVHLLHVAAPEPTFVGYDADGGPHDRDERAGELRSEHAELRELAGRFDAEAVGATPLLVEGGTVEIVLEEADRLDVRAVVVGTHGHNRLHRFLVGSTTEKLVRRSTRPVVVVPSDDQA